MLVRWAKFKTDQPARYLADVTGWDEQFMRRLLNGHGSKHTTLRVADELLTRIGCGYTLSNGEISILPNPRWTVEKYREYMQERGCV